MGGLTWSKDGGDWPNREASNFVDAAGIRWHVQRMGQGPSLLLLHGTGSATHSWRDLMPLLSRNFSVTAPDLPGHGFTQSPSPHRLTLPAMAADIGHLLRGLGTSPEIVVGHSAGAAILARMCLDGRIAPRLLVSLNGAFMPFGGILNQLISPLTKLLVVNSWVPRTFAWQASKPGTVERLIANTGSSIDARGVALYRKLVCSPAHVAAALEMMANWRLQPLLHDLPRLTTDLMLVVADDDRSISPDLASQVRAICPQARVEHVANGGHLVHEARPQVIATLIARTAAHPKAVALATPSS